MDCQVFEIWPIRQAQGHSELVEEWDLKFEFLSYVYLWNLRPRAAQSQLAQSFQPKNNSAAKNQFADQKSWRQKNDYLHQMLENNFKEKN